MLLLAVLVLVFATWFTIHIWLCTSLVLREPRWRGVVALVVPVLAPLWCYRIGLRGRSLAWGLTVCVYGAGMLKVFL